MMAFDPTKLPGFHEGKQTRRPCAKLGPECRINGLEPEILFAMGIAGDVFTERGFDCLFSSALDRVHSPGSLHYVGYAVDVWPGYVVRPEIFDELATEIRARLNIEFDIVAEPDHVHIEFQPKRGR